MSDNNPEKLLLIDGHSILNRAFYAMPPLTNKKGVHTNAVYGFMNILYKFFDEESPTYTAVAFDLSAPTFRHLQYAEYKGTRKPMPDELRPQVPLIKQLLRALGIPVCELEGAEADDILGTLAKKAQAEGKTAVIVSGDRDLLQIADERIMIRIPKTRAGKTEVSSYFAADVVAEYGVTPAQMIDVKALMGDPSDNIPGVTGIGEKTALKIIIEHGSLQNALSNANDIKPKRAGESLLSEKETALLSQSLATIKTDVDVDFKYESWSGEITEPAYELMQELELKNLLKRKSSAAVPPPDEPKSEAYLVATLAEIALADIMSFALFETEGEIQAVSVSGGSSSYVFKIETPFHEAQILLELKPFFENPAIAKVTHDLKRARKVLNSKDIKLTNVIFDCMVAAYVLDPLKTGYSPDSLAAEYLSRTIPSEAETLGKGKSKTSASSLPIADLLSYCGKISETLLALYPVMNAQIKEAELTKLYYEIEHPLIETLFQMEIQGIKVDRKTLDGFGISLSESIEKLTNIIFALAGEEFNINSPKQLGEILYEKLGLSSGRKTKTGYSTDIEQLERLKFEHPDLEIIGMIIEYRTFTKLKSTYIDGIKAALTAESKLHTTFNQTIAATGRLSSTEPNLQNIPIRLPQGRELRKAFIPDSPDYIFLDGDYSQIELRVLAHLSGDETLIEAFKSGLDIHRLTASQVNKMPYELITPGQRSAAKAVNFGIIYGIGSFSLSQDLGISKKEAEKYISAYFAAYPRIKSYLDSCKETARDTGFAKTMFGRRRPMPELHSSNFNVRSFGERVAMNMPIQGAAADIIKIAMLKVHESLTESCPRSRMILQVHDELLILAHKDELDTAREILKTRMESAVDMLAPLVADIHEGETWYDTK